MLVTDNGPQFSSTEIASFANDYGSCHNKSRSPHCPPRAPHKRNELPAPDLNNCSNQVQTFRKLSYLTERHHWLTEFVTNTNGEENKSIKIKHFNLPGQTSEPSAEKIKILKEKQRHSFIGSTGSSTWTGRVDQNSADHSLSPRTCFNTKEQNVETGQRSLM